MSKYSIAHWEAHAPRLLFLIFCPRFITNTICNFIVCCAQMVVVAWVCNPLLKDYLSLHHVSWVTHTISHDEPFLPFLTLSFSSHSHYIMCSINTLYFSSHYVLYFILVLQSPISLVLASTGYEHLLALFSKLVFLLHYFDCLL